MPWNSQLREQAERLEERMGPQEVGLLRGSVEWITDADRALIARALRCLIDTNRVDADKRSTQTE